MPQRDSDNIRREVEELLDRLDNFVPEERFISKIRKRGRRGGPDALRRAWASVARRAGRLTLGHALIAGIALLLVSTLFRHTLGAAAGPLLLTGLVLAAGAFFLSVIIGDSRRTLAGGRPEKRWRGQVIDYSEPSAASRIRDWLRGRRHR
jgi:VIT1/CCC1 family predicted Fe2+/Mn2+ transporter